MSLTPGKDRRVVPYEAEAAIRVGASAREQIETRWGLILVVFMRLLAALWIAQGLAQWAAFILPADELFDGMTTAQTAAVMFFSVIDLLAAVGLWLATPWGGVLWLFAAISQIFVAVGVRHAASELKAGADLLLIALYFALTWQAGKVSRRA